MKETKKILAYEDTTFINMLKSYGIRRILLSLDFKLAFALTAIFALSTIYFNVLNTLTIEIFSTYTAISAAMIAIIIAALTIIVSISDNDFITFISQKKSIYHNILFSFWYGSVISGISVAINVVGFLFTSVTSHQITINSVLIVLATFLTAYSVFIVIMAIGTVMRFGLYRAEYSRQHK